MPTDKDSTRVNQVLRILLFASLGIALGTVALALTIEIFGGAALVPGLVLFAACGLGGIYVGNSAMNWEVSTDA